MRSLGWALSGRANILGGRFPAAERRLRRRAGRTFKRAFHATGGKAEDDQQGGDSGHVLGAVGEERDGSTRWMTANSTPWPARHWPGSTRPWKLARPISTSNWRQAAYWKSSLPTAARSSSIATRLTRKAGSRRAPAVFIFAGMALPGAIPATMPN